MRILFLDDNGVRHRYRLEHADPFDNITYVWTADEAIEAMTEEPRFNRFELDHDLGGQVYVEEEKGSGTEVARYIATELPKEKYPDSILIHSWNRAGAVRMHGWVGGLIPTTWRKFAVN